MYGGSSKYPGIYFLIKEGKIKDPRDKDSTQETVQDFYNTVWKIMLRNYNKTVKFKKAKTYFARSEYAAYLLYRKYPSGFASARPYVFPKEVLATEIDFDKVPPDNIK